METITEQVEKFYKETGKRLEIKDGKPYYDGWLDLHKTAITSSEGLVKWIEERIRKAWS